MRSGLVVAEAALKPRSDVTLKLFMSQRHIIIQMLKCRPPKIGMQIILNGSIHTSYSTVCMTKHIYIYIIYINKTHNSHEQVCDMLSALKGSENKSCSVLVQRIDL